MIDRDSQHKQQREAMEIQRFGRTRAEILRIKGNRCAVPGCKNTDLQIDHINGGGRHDTERGIIVENKTHDMDNLQVLCSKHMGMKDRSRYLDGMGTRGNPNNPSQ